MEMPDYRVLMEQLQAEIPLWPPDTCTELLGILERLRVLAWARLLGGSANNHSGQNLGQLLTLPQVAERLAVPETYAYELARQNRLPVVRLGKYVRVPAEEFERWLAQQATLERRVDTKPSDFHSCLARNRRASKGNNRTSVKLEPKNRVGFRLQTAAEPQASEEDSE